MRPIEFPEQNTVYAKDQPQYLPLPVHRTEDGEVTACWGLSWRERWTLLLTGRLWFTVLTFNHPLQPQRPSVARPDFRPAQREKSELQYTSGCMGD